MSKNKTDGRTGFLPIIEYCAEETARQYYNGLGHEAARAVARMVNAWRDAIHRREEIHIKLMNERGNDSDDLEVSKATSKKILQSSVGFATKSFPVKTMGITNISRWIKGNRVWYRRKKWKY